MEAGLAESLRGSGKLLKVINTGGTIDSEVTPEGAMPTNGRVLRGLLDEILKEEPFSSMGLRVKIENPFNMDSQNILPPNEELMAKALFDALQDSRNDAVVMTMGTDTMPKVMAAVALMAQTPLPAVVTGAVKCPEEPNSDAKSNLRHAILAALELRKEKFYGIYVAFSYKLMPAWRVIEKRSDNKDAFKSLEGNIARFSGEGIEFHGNFGRYRLLNRGIPFYLNVNLNDNVKIFAADPGRDKEAQNTDLRSAARRADAIILVVGHSGGIPDYLEDTVRVIAKNKLVVISSEIGFSDPNKYETAKKAKEVGALHGYGVKNLDSTLARITLGIAGKIPDISIQQIKSIFTEVEERFWYGKLYGGIDSRDIEACDGLPKWLHLQRSTTSLSMAPLVEGGKARAPVAEIMAAMRDGHRPQRVRR